MTAAAITAESSLVARLRSGEAAAYEQLVRDYGGRLLAVTRRLMHNEEDAREALQDAFLSAFRGLERFDEQSQLGTWLHRIAVNSALMKLRSKQRRPESLIDDLLPRFREDGHQTEPNRAWVETADEAAQRRELREAVRARIGELPELYRTVLVLRDIEELSTEETANLLGESVGVVKTRLHRARQALRTLLDSRFRGESL